MTFKETGVVGCVQRQGVKLHQLSCNSKKQFFVEQHDHNKYLSHRYQWRGLEGKCTTSLA